MFYLCLKAKTGPVQIVPSLPEQLKVHSYPQIGSPLFYFRANIRYTISTKVGGGT